MKPLTPYRLDATKTKLNNAWRHSISLLSHCRAPRSEFSIKLFFLALLLFGLGSCDRLTILTEDNVFHTGQLDDLQTLDPAVAYDSASLEILPNIFETLYQYAYLKKPYQVEPLLAADQPRYSKDFLEVTIPIRRDVKFHDDPIFKNGKGRSLDAHDFIFSIKRMALPSLKSPGYSMIGDRILGLAEFRQLLKSANNKNIIELMDSPVEGLSAPDKYTLKIRLTKPYPQLSYLLTMAFTAVLPREAVKAYSDEKGEITKAIGSGAFKLASWEKGEKIILDRNDNYHADFYPSDLHPDFKKYGMSEDATKVLPFIDKIEISIFKTSSEIWDSFLNGEIDLLQNLPKENFKMVFDKDRSLTDALKNRGIRLHQTNDLAFYFLAFNTKHPVLAKKEVRQALSAAIDRKKFIEEFTQNTAIAMTSILPLGTEGRPKNTKLKFDFDLNLAKKLLEKSGYPNGKGFPKLTLDMRSTDKNARKKGEAFSNAFSSLGIEIQVFYHPLQKFLSKTRLGQFDISYSGWIMDYPDAENVYSLVYGPRSVPGPNHASFNNNKLNLLFEKMSAMEPSPNRSFLLKEMEAIVQDQVPWALLYSQSEFQMVQPWLYNFRESKVILNKLKYLKIDKLAKKKARKFYQKTRPTPAPQPTPKPSQTLDKPNKTPTDAH